MEDINEKTTDELANEVANKLNELGEKSISPISENTRAKISNKSAASLPNTPSLFGMPADQIRGAFYRPLTDDDESIISEINRIATNSSSALECLKEVLSALKNYVEGVENDEKILSSSLEEVGNTLEEKLNETQVKKQIENYSNENLIGNFGEQSINGTLNVTNLSVLGNTTVKNMQSMEVKDAIIVVNAEGETVPANIGYVIRVNDEEAYGIMFNPANKTIEIGLGKYTAEDKESEIKEAFTFENSQSQALATRELTTNHAIPWWDNVRMTLTESEGLLCSHIIQRDNQIKNGDIPMYKDNQIVSSGLSTSSFSTMQSVQGAANALKKTVRGYEVTLDDVSPIEHNLKVKLKSKNLFDVSKVLSNGHVINNDDGTITVNLTVQNSEKASDPSTLKDYAPDLEEGKTYIFSCETDADIKGIYLIGLEGSWVSGKKIKMTKAILEGIVRWTAKGKNTSATYSDIQIKEATDETEYTPYVDVNGLMVTVSGNGKEKEHLANAKDIKSIYPTTKISIIENVAMATDAGYIRGGVYANSQCQSENGPYIEVKDIDGDEFSVGEYERIAFVKFNISKFKGVSYEECILKLHFKEIIGERPYNIYVAEGEWDRSSLTANNSPEINEDYSIKGVHFYESEGEVDIKKLVDYALGKDKNSEKEESYLTIAITTYRNSNQSNESQTLIYYNKDVETSDNPYLLFTLPSDAEIAESVIMEVEYERDINKAFAELQQAILSTGGNV